MKTSKKINFLVGLFIIIAICSIFYVAIISISKSSFSNDNAYTVTAKFDNIGNLKTNASVRISGVVIGKVTKIYLDKKDYIATVVIEIDSQYNNIPDNSTLSIKTNGILGSQYIDLAIGFDDGSTELLKNGSVIINTHSAIILEDLIGKFLYNMNNGNK